MMTRDEKGQIAEQRFLLLALEQRLHVYRPVNAQAKADFLVETSKSYLKVQVKTSWAARVGTHRVNMSKKRTFGSGRTVRKVYEAGDFDILAVYEPDEKEFWIVPASVALKRTCMWLRKAPVSGLRSQGFEPHLYWKNWKIFGL